MTRLSGKEDSWKNWWERFGRWWNSLDRSSVSGDDTAGEGGDAQRSKRLRNLVLLALLGAGMMMLSQRSTEEVTTPPTSVVEESDALPVLAESGSSVEALARQLSHVLSQMEGAGRVDVIIVPKTSDIQVFSQEVTERTSVTQTMADGRSPVTTAREESVTRRPIIVNNDAAKSQVPVVEYVKKAEIGGVLVVADGANDSRIRLQLLKAVSALLDVSAHRIEIVPRKP